MNQITLTVSNIRTKNINGFMADFIGHSSISSIKKISSNSCKAKVNLGGNFHPQQVKNLNNSVIEFDEFMKVLYKSVN